MDSAGKFSNFRTQHLAINKEKEIILPQLGLWMGPQTVDIVEYTCDV
mgnify:CR=1 FL=1